MGTTSWDRYCDAIGNFDFLASDYASGNTRRALRIADELAGGLACAEDRGRLWRAIEKHFDAKREFLAELRAVMGIGSTAYIEVDVAGICREVERQHGT